MMKLTLIITDYGSFNNFLGDLAIDLVRSGYQVSVITSSLRVINIQDKFDYKGEGIEFYYVDFPRGFNPISHYRSSKKIHQILAQIAPDLVHIHFTTGIFTTIFSGRLKYRTFGTFHGLGFPVLTGIKKHIFGTVERFCFNRLDEIYVLNEVDLKAVKKLKYKNVHKYETLGLGCDLKVFDPSNYTEDQQNNLRSELGIKQTDFVFCYTGRFVNFKGYDIVIRSFIHLFNNYSNIKLLLIGGKDPIHPTGLTEEESEIMESCKGIVPIGFTKDVAKYLSITDTFVFPSVKEGMPVCIIEALAMGIPVITANSRGCNEIIKDNYNGSVVDLDFGNWQDIAKSMELLFKNPDVIEALKSNIVKDRKDYDRDRYVICEKRRYVHSTN